jgi:hypothetical protein
MNRLMLIGILLALASGLGFTAAVFAYIKTNTLSTTVMVCGGLAIIADLACVVCFIKANKARQAPPPEFR